MLSLVGSLVVAERKGDANLVSKEHIMESLDDHCTTQNQQAYHGKETKDESAAYENVLSLLGYLIANKPIKDRVITTRGKTGL